MHDSTDNTDISTSLSGGIASSTNFIIDVEGETGFALDFDTSKLANFINDITLPDQDIEAARLAKLLANLAAAGGVSLLNAIPVIGDIVAAGGLTAISVANTLANYAFDLEQVKAQEEAAIDAVNTLIGGTGNDTLDGGGFIYGENIEITGVITDDQQFSL